MEKGLNEKPLVSMMDHFELLSSIVGCASEVMDSGNNTNVENLEKEFAGMIAEVTKSLRNTLKFVVKQSARFHKKPSIWQRLKDWRDEREEKREERRMKNEKYRAFLKQEREREEAEADAREQAEAEEQSQSEDTSLPALWEEHPVDVLDADSAEGEEENSDIEE